MVSELDNGIALLFPEVREVKKYPYIKDLYVLERLVVVPDMNQMELPVSKLSYEPLWAYCNAERQPVTPMWEATKFLVDTLYAALGKSSLDSEKNTTKEGREERIQELQSELFGNETEASDALRYKQGIIVPNSYEKDK
jgi:hypothetical protein